MSCNVSPACGETGRSVFPQDGANMEVEPSGSKLGVMIIPDPHGALIRRISSIS